jgi:diguanylate cyclase (GGDEF)-like protein/PAS domain S-box-containing protein
VRKRLYHLCGSLKARLAFASLLLIAASVALTVVLVLRAMEQRSQRAALDAELANAERIAVVLSSKLVSMQNVMRDASVRLPATRLDEPGALTSYLADQYVLRGMFDSVLIASGDGMLLAAADEHGVRAERIDSRDRAYFRRTILERRPVISPPTLGRKTGAAMFALTMPVFDPRGHLLAMLVCTLRLDTNPLLNDLTRRAIDDHDPVTTIVTDSTGIVVSHPDASWLMKDARTDPRFADVVAQWTRQGTPIEPQGTAYRLGRNIVAVAGVPDADWVVFRSAPAEVLLGGPTAGRVQATWIGAMVAVAGGLVILLVTLALLRPLRLLERRALRLLTDDIAAADGWPRAGGELGALARVFQHVMNQKEAASRSSDELVEQMRAVMANAPVGIAFTRRNCFELVSTQFGQLFGYDIAHVAGMSSNVVWPSDEAHLSFMAIATAAFASGRTCDEERELVRADASRFWARLHGAPVRAGDADAGTIWIFTDITETRREREHLSWTASHDELTGLVNRREFELRLGEQLAGRADAEPAAALFIDLDRFKNVNDGAGHAAGDDLLKQIALILDSRARALDTVARVGGDEFAVLLRGCSPHAAERVAADICARVAEYRLAWGPQQLSVGASIGIVSIDSTFATVEEVLNAADGACYEAKRAGRGTVRTWRRAAMPGDERAAGGTASVEAH